MPERVDCDGTGEGCWTALILVCVFMLSVRACQFMDRMEERFIPEPAKAGEKVPNPPK